MKLFDKMHPNDAGCMAEAILIWLMVLISYITFHICH